jgi:hypothetical protein
MDIKLSRSKAFTRLFILDDSASGFDFFFEVSEHIVWNHVSPLVSCLLFTFWLLMLEKQFECICSIMIGEVIYRLIVCTLVI